MIRKTTIVAAVVLAWALPGPTARADEWDVADVSDAGISTRNAMLHGSEQAHDLAAVGSVTDEDWFVFVSIPRSSFQLVVDGMTGDLRLTGDDVQLLDVLGTTVVASGQVTDLGGSVSLVWSNSSQLLAPTKHFVRIRGADCGAACTAQDRYRVRFYDTTYAIPRFNNSGTQVTVTMVQNVTDGACDVTYLFLGSGNAPLGSATATVPPRGLHVLDTSTVVPGDSGHMRVFHTCGYGGLNGKAVALEPSTGFTFDTAMTLRPH